MEYFLAIVILIFTFLIGFTSAAYRKYKLLNRNLIKQSFSMTIAMGEYHMWVQDHMENYLIQQVMNNPAFLDFAKKSGLSVTVFEGHLKDAMKISADYIKLQSKECLRKVSEPLAQDINAVLEKQ